uniref:Uncharacterized protein n=1 Tax=Octopus bimaculoides TaxID=37653 RepID=A0A0L8G3P3_OCTBM
MHKVTVNKIWSQHQFRPLFFFHIYIINTRYILITQNELLCLPLQLVTFD